MQLYEGRGEEEGGRSFFFPLFFSGVSLPRSPRAPPLVSVIFPVGGCSAKPARAPGGPDEQHERHAQREQRGGQRTDARAGGRQKTKTPLGDEMPSGVGARRTTVMQLRSSTAVRLRSSKAVWRAPSRRRRSARRWARSSMGPSEVVRAVRVSGAASAVRAARAARAPLFSLVFHPSIYFFFF